MKEYVGPVEPMKIETELGAIYVSPISLGSVNVNAPYLTVDGMPLQATLFLVGGGDNFDLIRQFSPQGSSIADNAIRARFVDGRDADLVTLGKIAQVVVPAVRRLANANRGFFLEAERRRISNEISALENEIEHRQTKLAERRLELDSIKSQLP